MCMKLTTCLSIFNWKEGRTLKLNTNLLGTGWKFTKLFKEDS